MDVIDLGLRTVEFAGESKQVHKIRIVFETENKGTRFLARTFTASLHPKSRLAEFLGKWRGKVVSPGDTIDLDNLLGMSATLVLGHRQKGDGSGFYCSIDAISRPTKKVVPSGTYDPKGERERIAQLDARDKQRAPVVKGEPHVGSDESSAARPTEPELVDVGF